MKFTLLAIIVALAAMPTPPASPAASFNDGFNPNADDPVLALAVEGGGGGGLRRIPY